MNTHLAAAELILLTNAVPLVHGARDSCRMVRCEYWRMEFFWLTDDRFAWQRRIILIIHSYLFLIAFALWAQGKILRRRPH